jgi:hypothetical protein
MYNRVNDLTFMSEVEVIESVFVSLIRIELSGDEFGWVPAGWGGVFRVVVTVTVAVTFSSRTTAGGEG